MDYFIETGPVEKLQCDCIIVGVYQDRQLTAAANIINDYCQGAISQVLVRGDLSGKIGEALLLNWLPGQAFARILLVGLGENKPLTSKNYCKVLAAAAENLKKTAIQSVGTASPLARRGCDGVAGGGESGGRGLFEFPLLFTEWPVA